MTRSQMKRVEAAEINMIKACAVSLKDDTKHIAERSSKEDSTHRTMGTISSDDYNIRRTYHF